MKERIFDLESRREAAVAVIRLGGMEFRIVRVVIAARVMYSNYLSRVAALFSDISAAEGGKVDAKALMDRYGDFAQKAPDILLEIIQAILETNGIAFDRTWWENHSDVEDMRNFIDACMSKGDDGKGKKKAQG